MNGNGKINDHEKECIYYIDTFYCDLPVFL